MFSPASRLSDRSRVWVERSVYEGVDSAIDALFGPSAGREAWQIAADNSARYAGEALARIPDFENN